MTNGDNCFEGNKILWCLIKLSWQVSRRMHTTQKSSCTQLQFIMENTLKSAKRKGRRGKVQEKPGANLQVSPPRRVVWGCTILPEWLETTLLKCCKVGKFTLALMPRVFIGSWSHRYIAPPWLTETTQILASHRKSSHSLSHCKNKLSNQNGIRKALGIKKKKKIS